MAIKRRKTRNLVVVLSDTPKGSTEFDVRASYLSRHIPTLGSHYVILSDGDVCKGREHDEHGNVLPNYNRSSVYIEVVGQEYDDITEAQHAAIRGVISRLQEIYPEAEELDLTL